MTKTITISVTDGGQVIYSALQLKLPGYSFSSMLREVSSHYLECGNYTKYCPGTMADIGKWRRYINSMSKEEVMAHQQRNSQLSNLLRKRTEQWL